MGGVPRKRNPHEVDEVVEEADRRYESMTPAEREKYYVHPNLWQRILRFWRP
jgi:hypothetical protein